MKVSVATDRLTFTQLTDADLPVLHDWLGREHVSRWWGPQRSLDEVVRDYHPAQRCFGGVMFFLIRLDAEPLGFIQRYAPIEHHHEGWWLEIDDPGVRGVDVFLASESHLDHGLGSTAVAAFVDRLFEDPQVTEIIADPAPDNLRAVHCFRNAGFIARQVVKTPDGPALLMTLPRPE